MKKHLLIGILTIGLGQIALASDKKKELSSPSIHKGNFTVTIGYGFPSIIRTYLKLKTDRDQLRVRGEGPFMVKFDYMIRDHWSIGIDGAYSHTKLSWMDDGYDPAIKGNRPYEYGINAKEFSGTFRANYHFKKTTHSDFYAGAAFGYGKVSLKTYTLAPYNQFQVAYDFPRPYNFEFTVAGRYFITNHIGLYSELGIGKAWLAFSHFIPEALIQGGAVVKF